MQFEDVRVNENYIYDKDNTLNQLECGVNVVQVIRINKGYFGFNRYIKVVPMNMQGEPMPNQAFQTSEELLSPMGQENIIVRYPTDLPAFSIFDTQIVAKVAQYSALHQKEFDLSDQELLLLTGVLNKINFYARISEEYRPDIGGDTDAK